LQATWLRLKVSGAFFNNMSFANQLIGRKTPGRISGIGNQGLW